MGIGGEFGFGSYAAKTFAISAATGGGVDGLVETLEAFARDFFASTEAPVVTRSRHRAALERTIAALDRALGEGESGREEVVAEELRLAATELGRLTGRVDVRGKRVGVTISGGNVDPAAFASFIA